VIQISHLSRHYGTFKAVDDVSFTIQQGEIVGLLGHNGAGKTTIMKMITGFLEATAGTIEINGLFVGSDTQKIQQHIGYLPENCPAWPEMTVIDYLEYQAGLHGISEKNRQKAVVHAIRRTALKEKASSTIQTLSRGYRQRVGVAQAILHQPDIIILDEPTNGLDPTQVLHMRQLIRELARNATVILSTHILQEVQAVCDRVLIMRNGRLAVDSNLDELQSGRQLRLTTDNKNAFSYLQNIQGVEQVKLHETNREQFHFILDISSDIAPEIATAVADAGDRLFLLQPQKQSLETLFAEVNGASTVLKKEVAHA